MIHAIPQRIWYVEGFLLPMLKEQGAENITIWNDRERKGNLEACLSAFESLEGNGGTWHLQDDVLPCRDFVKRCEKHDEGLVYGFCCRNFNDRLNAYGEVYMPDAWNSFQCVRIPDGYARECAEWVRSEAWRTESASAELPILVRVNKGDDTFFHEFMIARHGTETALNLKPNLVEHIDYMIGGSAVNWRDYVAISEYFDDRELIKETHERIKRFQARS